MLASVNDVQQLSQQMSSLLAIIKDKSAENTDLLRQNTRLKQLATIQTDLRLQVEGQRQQLLQYQVLERESLQLKVSAIFPAMCPIALTACRCHATMPCNGWNKSNTIC